DKIEIPHRAGVAQLDTAALQSRCVKLGDTRPVRDFNFVSDTAAGFLAAAQHAPGRAEVYNLATGRAQTIGETADLIAELVGSRIEIEHDASRDRPADSEVMRLLGNAEKARRELGWQPAVDFRTGLQQTIAWVRENQQAYADAASFKS
ncbi:MAG TPA: GDP-mannose 4,6-dehydratase, partial [Candidatus Rifleibacterium sp.]|nr:GDP-mannose 4,6-dehydratase [Candidatus Rifleibacterium sp.]